jgi:hypothetical protein
LSARYLRIAELSCQAEVAVLQHRHLVARIDRRIFRLVLLAGEEIDNLVVELDAGLGRKQNDRPARRRHRMIVELHACLLAQDDVGGRVAQRHIPPT